MATDYGIEVLIDNTASAAKKTAVVEKILQALAAYTRTTTYAATYSAGSTSGNAVTVTVAGTGTVGIGVRVTMDKTALGVDKAIEVLLKVLQAVVAETTTLAIAALQPGTPTAAGTMYTAGDRTYNVVIAVS